MLRVVVIQIALRRMEWIPREKEDQLKTVTTKSETVEVFFHFKKREETTKNKN